MPGSDPSTVRRKSSVDDSFDLPCYSDEEFGDSAVYLFPVLIRIWTRSCIPECRFRRLQRRLQIGPTLNPRLGGDLSHRDRDSDRNAATMNHLQR